MISPTTAIPPSSASLHGRFGIAGHVLAWLLALALLAPLAQPLLADDGRRNRDRDDRNRAQQRGGDRDDERKRGQEKGKQKKQENDRGKPSADAKNPGGEQERRGADARAAGSRAANLGADGADSCVVISDDDDDGDDFPFCAGEVMIRFQPGKGFADLPTDVQEKITGELGAIPTRDTFLYGLQTGEGETGIIDKVREAPGVAAWAELNFVGNAPQGNPSRFFPRTDANQNAPKPAQTGDSYGRAKIGADRAPCVDGRNVRVAVIDTGLDVAHPAFAGRVDGAWNAFDGSANVQDVGDGVDNDQAGDDGEGGSQNGLVDEAAGHGTHVAGVVLQAAPRASVMPIKALDSDGVGQAFFLAKAIARAVDQNADVINLSLGARGESVAVREAVQEALDAGVVVVAAAGNAGGEDNGAVVAAMPEFPAAMGGVLAIGATDQDDRAAAFSSRYGAVDLSAPGVAIKSAFPQGEQGVRTRYAAWSGTSMATPWAAGAVALLLHAEPNLSPDQVADRLATAHDPIVGNGQDMGVGRLDVSEAIACP
jgi:subtilisin family serine protease